MLLLERESALTSLEQSAVQAAQGHGRLVLIAGEAGVGKSVLVEQLQARVPSAKWSFGSCDGISTPRPLGPVFDLAEELGGRLAALIRTRPDRDELFRALLTEVSGSSHLQVLVIEDIHWADEATLDLLRFLARRIRTSAVMIIASYRNDWLAAAVPLRLALGELATLRWTRRLELVPLSLEAVRSMVVGTHLDPVALYDLTGGNPFYISEIIAAGSTGVPLSARDAVLARSARVSDDARTVLSYASLVGHRVEPALLNAATRCTPSVLDELINAGLLVDDGVGLRFRHEIARLAVEQQIPVHRRAALHADLLTALQSTDATDDDRMAWHAEGAGNDAAVLHHALRAARRAADLGAHRESVDQYQRALRSSSGADPAIVAGLYSGLAQQATLGDSCEVAAQADERALALWRELGEPLQQGETLRRWSIDLLELGRGDEALSAIAQAVAVLEPLGPTTELAATYATFASSLMMRQRGEEAIELAGRAREVAHQVGAIEAIADALNTEGCVRTVTDLTAGVELIRRALELALSRNFQAQAGRAYGNLYGMLVDHYRYGDAEQCFLDGIAYCGEHDLDSFSYFLRAVHTSVLLNRGNWDETLALGMQLLEERTTSPTNQICLRLRMGIVFARRADPAAWDELNWVAAAADGTGQPQYIVPVRLARAEACWLEGRQSDARREAELAADRAVGADPFMLGALGGWLRRTSSSRSVDGTVSAPHELLRDGRCADAARLWDELGCPYDAAMSLLDSPDEGDVRGALRRFDELGAAAAARVARHRLRSLGAKSIPAGPRKATRSHPLGLTPREQEVLELISERRTNAEIAQSLFISAKTVDHHVSAVLAKLDAGSREAAAAVAMRLGIVAARI